MSYKEINLQSVTQESLSTEIMYEIAACRADGIELLRLNILPVETDEGLSDVNKLASYAIRTLKGMKQRGAIQFFATESSFESDATEAVFLTNKYPERFSAMPSTDGDGRYLYIKI